jgi:hypothetical protein
MKKNIMLLAMVCLILASADLYAQRENRNVSGFTRVEFRIPGKFYIRQGSADKVEIEGSKDILSKIETEVEGSKLLIHTPGKYNWKSGDDDVKVYITIQRLEGLGVSGSGDLVGESKFTTNDLNLKVSGSGSLKLDVESSGEVDADVSGSGDLDVKGTAKSFESSVSGSGRVTMAMNISGKTDFNISGSGRIEASGKTDNVDVTISGSGKVLAADLETVRCDVKISGSGNVEINVKEELESHISGSGSVSYRGNPSKINNNASGSGTLRKM